jgi:hypothetical protein
VTIPNITIDIPNPRLTVSGSNRLYQSKLQKIVGEYTRMFHDETSDDKETFVVKGLFLKPQISNGSFTLELSKGSIMFKDSLVDIVKNISMENIGLEEGVEYNFYIQYNYRNGDYISNYPKVVYFEKYYPPLPEDEDLELNFKKHNHYLYLCNVQISDYNTETFYFNGEVLDRSKSYRPSIDDENKGFQNMFNYTYGEDILYTFNKELHLRRTTV